MHLWTSCEARATVLSEAGKVLRLSEAGDYVELSTPAHRTSL
jgi:hypothetical protein